MGHVSMYLGVGWWVGMQQQYTLTVNRPVLGPSTAFWSGLQLLQALQAESAAAGADTGMTCCSCTACTGAAGVQ